MGFGNKDCVSPICWKHLRNGAVDEGYGLDVIYLDYRKAFDTVPHGRLLQKLNACGLNDKVLKGTLTRSGIKALYERWYKQDNNVTHHELLKILDGGRPPS